MEREDEGPTTRPAVEERFRLPGSSYEELVKIIRAYGNLGKEAVPADVGQLAVVHGTIVSRNNAFLVGIGVITGGRKKMVTEKGLALARALDHDMPDAIMQTWREVVLATEFLQKLVTAVRIRKGMEHSTLQAHVAYSAGLPKSQSVMTGAGAVVDILKASGLIKEHEGKLVATTDEVPVAGRVATTPLESAQVRTPPAAITTTRLPESGIAVTLQIQVQCTASEIETLGPKLRSLLKELTQATLSEDSPARE